ncbi:MAG TPA: outer membrane beta-barrel protein [Chryseosolibacter sp.]
MKRLFIFAILLTSSCGLFAQLDRGNFRIGGTAAGFSTGKQGKSIQKRDLYIGPTVAYFVIDRLSIGLTVPFSANKSTFPTATSKSWSYSIGPEVRYYFPFNDWAVFPMVSYSAGKTQSKTLIDGNEPSESKSIGREFKTGTGITYFINSSVAIEAILSYTNSFYGSSSYNTDENRNRFFNMNFGLQIYLPGKTKE